MFKDFNNYKWTRVVQTEAIRSYVSKNNSLKKSN